MALSRKLHVLLATKPRILKAMDGISTDSHAIPSEIGGKKAQTLTNLLRDPRHMEIFRKTAEEMAGNAEAYGQKAAKWIVNQLADPESTEELIRLFEKLGTYANAKHFTSPARIATDGYQIRDFVKMLSVDQTDSLLQLFQPERNSGMKRRAFLAGTFGAGFTALAMVVRSSEQKLNRTAERLETGAVTGASGKDMNRSAVDVLHAMDVRDVGRDVGNAKKVFAGTGLGATAWAMAEIITLYNEPCRKAFRDNCIDLLDRMDDLCREAAKGMAPSPAR
jgi:hypothetical protein